MVGTTPTAQVGAVSALVAVAALGAVTIVVGSAAPSKTGSASDAVNAAFDPSKVTLVAQRDWRPWERHWSARE